MNDVASVNIDSKLISARNGAAGMVELQNGCACCSLSEELLGSVSELVTLNDMRGDSDGFHHIVIELSGVADPKSIRSKFQEALLYDMPLMERVQLDTMVTVVDCSMFLEYLKTSKSATPDESPELFYPEGKAPPSGEKWQDDIPPMLLEALMAGENAYGTSIPVDQENGVADLLVSQTEISDVVLLNKVDLADQSTVMEIEEIVKALNPRATLFQCQFGKVPFSNILGVARGQGVVQAGIVDDHKDAVGAANHDNSRELEIEDRPKESYHSHDHSDHAEITQDHFHAHDHGHDCNDHSSTDPSHHHSHSHDHKNCIDPECTDPSHSHDHTHANIGSFVYRARRPFHPGRLLAFLRHLPIVRGLPPSESDDDSKGLDLKLSESSSRDMKRILRSKGFAWCADSNQAALYWSHAGSSFELSALGRWWATLPRNAWPPEATPAILSDFDDTQHNEENSNFVTVGDRRQELVFIGPKIGESTFQRDLCDTLDRCILNEEEWSVFKENRSQEAVLRARFPNQIQSKIMSY